MSRLTCTYKDENNITMYERKNVDIKNQQLIDKLGELEDKEEQGLLIELPCKVGDKLYQIGEGYYQIGSDITEYTVTAFTISQQMIQMCVKNGDLGFVIRNTCIGERFFLTRSEAEEALAKMGGK